MEKKLENIYCLSCTCRHFFRRPTLSKTHFQLGISLPTKLDRKKSAPRIDRSSSSYTGGGGFAPMKPITYCSQVMHPLKGCEYYLLGTIKKAYHLVKESKFLFPIGRIFLATIYFTRVLDNLLLCFLTIPQPQPTANHHQPR